MPDDSEDVGDVLDLADGSDVLTDEGHLKFCNCGHSYEDHGCDAALDREEHSRRARVAVRIDEFLEVCSLGQNNFRLFNEKPRIRKKEDFSILNI